MSVVQNTPEPQSEERTQPPLPLIPPARARSVERAASIERGERTEQFGAVAATLTRAALFPASKAGLSADKQTARTTNGQFVVKFAAGMRMDPDTGELIDDEVPVGGYANFGFLWLAAKTRAAIVDGWTRTDGPIPLPGVRTALTAAAGIGRGANQERYFLTALRRVQNVDANVWFKEEGENGIILRKESLMGEHSSEFFYDTGNELPGLSPHFTPTPLMEWFSRQPGAAPVPLHYLAALANSTLAQQALLWASREVWALQHSRDHFRDFRYVDLADAHTHDMKSVQEFAKSWRAALVRIFGFWPALESLIDFDVVDPFDKRRRMIRITRSSDRNVQLIQDQKSRTLLLSEGFEQL